jgi:UDP-N-acetylmuramate--alanine ligase
MSSEELLSLDHKQSIHFIGIGGAGMSGIAEVLLTKGHQISGSDMHESEVTQRLKKLGAEIHIGHSSTNINGAGIVVISSAIDPKNPEVIRAQEKQLPILQRAKMLALLMHSYQSITVAGTHGKTTTTSLIASVLAEANLDPTFVIGGLLKSAGCNAQLGQSSYFVAEADESDASFLLLQPEVAVVTNIDQDHLSTYGDDFNQLIEAFLEFIEKVPEHGAKVLCGDDPVIAKLLPKITAKVLTYGFGQDNIIRAENYQQHALVAQFTLIDTILNQQFEVKLAIPGRHNVLNALAAYTVARHYGIDAEKTLSALAKFQGVGRRFQLYDNIKIPAGQISLVDDYGHHPRELQVTIDAVRNVWPHRRLVMVFQPHRYSRTSEMMDEFVNVLKGTDQLVLMEIYAAGEAPIPGITSAVLAEKFEQQTKKPLFFVQEKDKLLAELGHILQDGDVVLMQGAGDISKIVQKIVENPQVFLR